MVQNHHLELAEGFGGSKGFDRLNPGLKYLLSELFKRLASDLYLCKDFDSKFLPYLERLDFLFDLSSGLVFIDGVKYSLSMN